jgi:Zn-dependent protease
MILLLNMVHMVSSDLTGSMDVYVLLHVALLNIVLAMFNLIPIPPLDGSHLFKYFLLRELRAGYEMLGRTGAGFIILILVINIPVLWNISSTVLFGVRDFLLSNLIFSGLAWAWIFGVFISTLSTLVVVPVLYYMAYAKRLVNI